MKNLVQGLANGWDSAFSTLIDQLSGVMGNFAQYECISIEGYVTGFLESINVVIDDACGAKTLITNIVEGILNLLSFADPTGLVQDGIEKFNEVSRFLQKVCAAGPNIRELESQLATEIQAMCVGKLN